MVDQEENKDWIEEVEQEKAKIKNWLLTDRLSMVSKLAFMNGTLAASVTGWNAWLSSARLMEKLSEEELKELTQTFEKLALDFLELDLKYTKIVKDKQKEAKAKHLESLKEKSREESRKKATYVA